MIVTTNFQVQICSICQLLCCECELSISHVLEIFAFDGMFVVLFIIELYLWIA